MFTGIIETMGSVVSAVPSGGDVRIAIRAPAFEDKHVKIGDSVACNGVCLTVVEISGCTFAFDVSVESMNHSLIGDWKPQSSVNLELALQPQSRLGGHLVSGHVDGLADVIEVTQEARSWRIVFKAPKGLQQYIAKKGSITVNGVSLTVNGVNGAVFDVNIIPHTFEVTTLGDLKVGSKVHIEVDQIARYLERLLSDDGSIRLKSESKLSYSFLSEHGFA